jgi:hypothetical protein
MAIPGKTAITIYYLFYQENDLLGMSHLRLLSRWKQYRRTRMSEGAQEYSMSLQDLSQQPRTKGPQSETFVKLRIGQWSRLASDYSQLALTYASDRLPALASLASVAESIIKSRYLLVSKRSPWLGDFVAANTPPDNL